MRKKILSVVALGLIIQLSSSASVSVDQTLSQEYMMNNGYSKQIYNTVNIGRARALGQELYSSEEQNYQNMPKRWHIVRKIQAYIDPAIDDYSFYHHDISPEPYFDDL